MPQERVADSQTGWSQMALARGGLWEDLRGEEVMPGLGDVPGGCDRNPEAETYVFGEGGVYRGYYKEKWCMNEPTLGDFAILGAAEMEQYGHTVLGGTEGGIRP